MNTEIIRKLYEYTENLTPLRGDCGKLCSSKCCKGSNDEGMLLLPGEEKLFEGNNNFEIYYDERYDSKAVVCKGMCNRNERPFACRIFPYMLYAEKCSRKVSVAPDIRAIDYCPLLSGEIVIERRFLRALRICAKKLSQNEEMLEYLNKITEILTDFNGIDCLK